MTTSIKKMLCARPSTPLALPLFKCLNELVTLAIENLGVHFVSSSVLLKGVFKGGVQGV